MGDPIERVDGIPPAFYEPNIDDAVANVSKALQDSPEFFALDGPFGPLVGIYPNGPVTEAQLEKYLENNPIFLPKNTTDPTVRAVQKVLSTDDGLDLLNEQLSLSDTRPVATDAPADDDLSTGTDDSADVEEPTGVDESTDVEEPTGTDESTDVEEPTGTDESTDNTYNIQAGDTLSEIAQTYGTTVEALQLLNSERIVDPDLIYTGDTIAVNGVPDETPQSSNPPEDEPSSSEPSEDHAESTTVAATADRTTTANADGQWPVPGSTEINLSEVPEEGDGHFGTSRGGGTRTHKGLDIVAEVGDPVVSYAGGEVTHVQPTDKGNAGIWVQVTHDDGTVTRYMHLNDTDVQVGQRVDAGEPIGSIGRTGNTPTGGDTHLHFEIHQNGVAVDPELVFASQDQAHPPHDHA